MPALFSRLSVVGRIIAASGGQLTYAPQEVANTAPVAESYELALTATPQLITLPVNAAWFGVTPPSSNAVAIYHKWAEGDTGAQVHPVYGIPACGVGANPATFYLWSDSNVNVTVWCA